MGKPQNIIASHHFQRAEDLVVVPCNQRLVLTVFAQGLLALYPPWAETRPARHVQLWSEIESHFLRGLPSQISTGILKNWRARVIATF
jgi:hypothetical protein